MKSKKLSENILKTIKSRGYKYIELDAIIAADQIIQRSGENFRQYMFSFQDPNGNEMCLRPDLTIVSCLRYLNNKTKTREKIFYSGQAFRKIKDQDGKIIRNQVGYEIIGSKNIKQDDYEIIQTSLKTIQKIKKTKIKIEIGNIKLFNLLLDKLKLPKRWKLRLSRHFWREKYFETLIKRLETNSDIDPLSVEIDKKRYNKMKSENQSQIIGGRKISEILNRFNNKIKDPRKFAEGKKTASIIREYLKISCPTNAARKKLNNFFSKHKIKINLKDEFFPLKDKLGKNKIIFSTNFGRELEYYTGMVFNIKDQSSTNLIQGGRYDNLLSNLGSNRKIPAVGAAINLNSYDN
ncbi:MAG: ATP phosphoribosyltransferase regulatory subunit [Pelagibacteraceae bacterium]|jgi:ATP phosphoribosyltransferase regulatory subunit|nr:ATP phosphoribosyltransferase regulatory subunit [Pelagibacteraceae bacterium]|tara:strand:- start:721 stop:1770 length:1050 start_codon:yes stop_codon:yes gene_type:complete